MTRVADLAGADLDLWVAKATGVDAVLSDPYRNGTRSAVTFYSRDHDGVLDGRSFCPSEHWSDGGPLIDQHDIELRRLAGGGWFAELWVDHADGSGTRGAQPGDTRLIAAMRALVASVYGDNVPDEVGS